MNKVTSLSLAALLLAVSASPYATAGDEKTYSMPILEIDFKCPARQ